MVSVCTFDVQAMNAPLCMNKFCPGAKSKVSISPGAEGAMDTQPPLDPAVNVLSQNDSPPTIDFAILLRNPPTPFPPPIPVLILKSND